MVLVHKVYNGAEDGTLRDGDGSICRTGSVNAHPEGSVADETALTIPM